MRYFDASAVVKRFVREPASADVNRWLREMPAATSRITLVEIVSAAARRTRAGDLSPRALQRVLTALEADARRYTLLELTESVVTGAQDLSVSRALRANDAIQLASAVALRARLGRPVDFVCYDAHLSAAARGEGLRVLGAG